MIWLVTILCFGLMYPGAAAESGNCANIHEKGCQMLNKFLELQNLDSCRQEKMLQHCPGLCPPCTNTSLEVPELECEPNIETDCSREAERFQEENPGQPECTNLSFFMQCYQYCTECNHWWKDFIQRLNAPDGESDNIADQKPNVNERRTQHGYVEGKIRDNLALQLVRERNRDGQNHQGRIRDGLSEKLVARKKQLEELKWPLKERFTDRLAESLMARKKEIEEIKSSSNLTKAAGPVVQSGRIDSQEEDESLESEPKPSTRKHPIKMRRRIKKYLKDDIGKENVVDAAVSTEHEEYTTITVNDFDLTTQDYDSLEQRKTKSNKDDIQEMNKDSLMNLLSEVKEAEQATIYSTDGHKSKESNDFDDEEGETDVVDSYDEDYKTPETPEYLANNEYMEESSSATTDTNSDDLSTLQVNQENEERVTSEFPLNDNEYEETPKVVTTSETKIPTEAPLYLVVDDMAEETTVAEYNGSKITPPDDREITIRMPMKQYWAKINNTGIILPDILMNKLEAKEHQSMCIDLFPDCEDYIALAELKHPGIGTCEMKMVKAVCEKSCKMCDHGNMGNEIISADWLENYISTVRNVYDKLTNNDTHKPFPAKAIVKILNGDFDVEKVDKIQEVTTMKSSKRMANMNH